MPRLCLPDSSLPFPVLDAKRPAHVRVSKGTDLPLPRLLDSFRLETLLSVAGELLLSGWLD